MKIYLASRYSLKERMLSYTSQLENLGFTVVSTWPTEPHEPNVKLSEVHPIQLRDLADRDIAELNSANILVFFSCDPEEPIVRGGARTEFGYALAQKKTILVVGPKENIFHYTRQFDITHHPTWLDAVEHLLEIKNAIHSTDTED